jgi:hypothetical protein
VAISRYRLGLSCDMAIIKILLRFPPYFISQLKFCIFDFYMVVKVAVAPLHFVPSSDSGRAAILRGKTANVALTTQTGKPLGDAIGGIRACLKNYLQLKHKN